MSNCDLLIVGGGNLTSYIVDILAKRHDGLRISVGVRDVRKVTQRVNLARLSAVQLGYDPNLSVVSMDLDSIEESAATIAEIAPKMILHAASRQAWWVTQELPQGKLARVDQAQVGPWLPMQLDLLHKLMLAISESGHKCTVLNACLPDVTHSILAAHGLAPDLGIGNVANATPVISRAAADLLDADLKDIEVRLVAEHFVSTRLPKIGHAEGAPYDLAIYKNGVDVTSPEVVQGTLDICSHRYARTGGREGVMLTAASAVRAIDALTGTVSGVLHAPGAQNMIGGFPVTLTDSEPRIALREGLELEEAVKMNVESLAREGIEGVDASGVVTFTEEHMAVMREELGYSHESLRLEDCSEMAKELKDRYLKYKGC